MINHTLLAKVCFILCAATMMAKLLYWGLSTSHTTILRASILFVCGGLIVFGFVEAMQLTDRQHGKSFHWTQDLNVRSSDNVQVQVRDHYSPDKTHGLVMVLTNHYKNLGRSSVSVRDAQSYKTEANTFRESYGFEPCEIEHTKALQDGGIIGPVWLVKIKQDHLELGKDDTRPLKRPPGDSSNEEIWLFRMAFQTDTADLWVFDIAVKWDRQSGTLWVATA